MVGGKHSPKQVNHDRPSPFAYIVAKAPGSQAYDDFMDAALKREREHRAELLTKEYSLEGDEKALKALLKSDA